MALLIIAQWNVTVFHYLEGKVHGSVDHRTVECYCSIIWRVKCMALLIIAQWNVTVFHYLEGKVHGSVDHRQWNVTVLHYLESKVHGSVDHRTVECHCVPLSGG